MKLTAPKPFTWGAAAVFGITGVLVHYRILKAAFLEPYGFWLIIFAAALLALGVLFESL